MRDMQCNTVVMCVQILSPVKKQSQGKLQETVM